MLRLISVLRLSTDGQAGEDREGLDRQRTSLRLIVEQLRREHPDVVVLPPVEVIGVSGSDLTRTPIGARRRRRGSHRLPPLDPMMLPGPREKLAR